MLRTGVAAIAIVFAFATAGCASGPVRPPPGRSGVSGTVQLVPREGVPVQGPSGAYGDRRLRDVRWVDYSKPGFTVVYLDLSERPGGRADLSVEEGLTGLRLAPRVDAIGVGGQVVITNRSTRSAVVSVPAAALVRSIEAGAQLSLPVDAAGPLQIFLLGAEEPATVWASPGPWTRVDAAGRFALTDLAPGRFTLRAWHPRFPSASAEIALEPDRVTEVALQIGVGRGEAAHEAH